jgi:flavin-dependent dehydrogenase
MVPSHGVALRRPEFDSTLLTLAAEAGAKVRTGVRIESANLTEGRWVVCLSDGTQVSARLLVGADGRKSWTARMLGLALPAPTRRVALHVDLPVRTATDPFGEMHIFRDGNYLGIDPIDPDTLNVSLVCNPEDLRESHPEDLLNRYVAGSRSLGKRLAPLTRGRAISSTFPASSACRSASGPQAALIGDASGFLDPLTGEGIYQALWSASDLSRRMVAGWQADESFQQALTAYARERVRHHRAKRMACRAFQRIIRHPRLTETVFDALALHHSFGDAFIGMIGNTFTPWQAIGHLFASRRPTRYLCINRT